MSVLDNILARGRQNYHDPHMWDRFVSAGRRAQRFTFSRAASAMAGQLAREAPRLVIDNRQFAIPPFDPVYVEMDAEGWFARSGTTNQDLRIGYLIDGTMLRVVVEGAVGRHHPLDFPFAWHLSPPGAERAGNVDLKVRPGGETLESAICAYALGTASAILTRDEVVSIGSSLGLSWAYRMDKYDEDIALKTLVDSAGDIKSMWTLLLWLNQPSRVHYSQEPAGRRIRGGKLVAYAAHRVVEIDIGHCRTVRAAFRSGLRERLSPRRHQVRGHFSHRGGNVHCHHQWPLLADQDGDWRCTRCGRLRWWRENYVRGDATRGWVEHEYDVTGGDAP